MRKLNTPGKLFNWVRGGSPKVHFLVSKMAFSDFLFRGSVGGWGGLQGLKKAATSTKTSWIWMWDLRGSSRKLSLEATSFRKWPQRGLKRRKQPCLDNLNLLTTDKPSFLTPRLSLSPSDPPSLSFSCARDAGAFSKHSKLRGAAWRQPLAGCALEREREREKKKREKRRERESVCVWHWQRESVRERER